MATNTNSRMKKGREKLAAKRQQQIQSLRKSKRENLIATRRQLAAGQSRVIPNEALNRLHAKEVVSQKHAIYIACQQVMANEPEVKLQGARELNDLLSALGDQQTMLMQKIVQIMETGAFEHLLKAFVDTTTEKKLYSQILTNLCLCHHCEAKKMLRAGILSVLQTELDKSSITPVKVNVVWALSNLAMSDDEVKYKILEHDSNIFLRLQRAIGQSHGSQRLIGEAVLFVKSMMVERTDEQLFDSYRSGILLVAQALDVFEFQGLNRDGEGHLLDIVSVLNQFNDIEVDLCGSITYPGTHELGQHMSKMHLHFQLVKILQEASNHKLLSWTWRLVGVLANAADESTHISSFFKHANLMQLCQAQLHVELTVKNSLFAISNILADSYIYVDAAIKLGFFKSLSGLYSSLESKNTKLAKTLKQELVYCFGNSTIGVQNTLRDSRRDLVGAMLRQGGLHTLTSVVKEGGDGACIRSALEGLAACFSLFKGSNDYEPLLIEFEKLGGVDALERCQYHPCEKVYWKAVRIIKRHFHEDSEEAEPAIRLISEIIRQQKAQAKIQAAPVVQCTEADGPL